MIEQPCGYLNRRAYTHLNTEIKNSTYVGLFVLMFTSYYQLYPRHDINYVYTWFCLNLTES